MHMHIWLKDHPDNEDPEDIDLEWSDSYIDEEDSKDDYVQFAARRTDGSSVEIRFDREDLKLVLEQLT